MNWIVDKYEYLFYLIYRKFKIAYPKNDDIIRYPIFILNIPISLVIGFAYNCCFSWMHKIVPIIIGLFVIVPQFYYFDKRISRIENRYKCKEKGNSNNS